ncbi:unnamed protein product [Scytosiphon promiscuus]
MEAAGDTRARASEEQFAYVASEVFSIVSPYVFHTHAPRVFSAISECLRGAQEASADVMIQLEASEMAKEHERRLRAEEAERYVSRLRELQALMKGRLEREIEGAKSRKILKRKLREEASRRAELEGRLGDTQDEIRLLRKEFDSERGALEEWWRSTLDQAVLAAQEAERNKARQAARKASTKVETAMVERLRSLSCEVTQLKGKIELLEAENAAQLEALRSQPRADQKSSSFRWRAEKEISRLSAAAAAAATLEKDTWGSGSSEDDSGDLAASLVDMFSGFSERGLDFADRIKRSISEHAPWLGASTPSPQPKQQQQQQPQRGGCYFSDDDNDDDDDDGGGIEREVEEGHELAGDVRRHQTRGRGRRRPRAAGGTRGDYELIADGESTGITEEVVVLDPCEGPAAEEAAAATAAAAAGVQRRAPWGGEEGAQGASSGRRRRGLGSIGHPYPDRGDDGCVLYGGDGGGGGGGGAAPFRHTSATEIDDEPRLAQRASATPKGSGGRWLHQHSLGGGGNDAVSNAPSLHALLASGEFFPDDDDGGGRGSRSCGVAIADGIEGTRKGVEFQATGGSTQQQQQQQPPPHRRRLDERAGDQAAPVAGVEAARDFPRLPVRRASSSFRWRNGSVTGVDLRDHNDVPYSRLSEGGDSGGRAVGQESMGTGHASIGGEAERVGEELKTVAAFVAEWGDKDGNAGESEVDRRRVVRFSIAADDDDAVPAGVGDGGRQGEDGGDQSGDLGKGATGRPEDDGVGGPAVAAAAAAAASRDEGAGHNNHSHHNHNSHPNNRQGHSLDTLAVARGAIPSTSDRKTGSRGSSTSIHIDPPSVFRSGQRGRGGAGGAGGAPSPPSPQEGALTQYAAVDDRETQQPHMGLDDLLRDMALCPSTATAPAPAAEESAVGEGDNAGGSVFCSGGGGGGGVSKPVESAPFRP